MIKSLFIFLSIITISIKSNANNFFGVDKNDYTKVEKAFKNETPPLFNYKGNKFCKNGILYLISYSEINGSKANHTSGKLKSWFFSLSFGHAIASYLEGEINSELAYKKEDFMNELK